VLTVGSLFSGIGGLDLGLERAGMEVIWQSEIDPYGCRVLKKHWPEVVNHGNIKEINWRDVVRPDIICGGYPCQPFSTAGKRNGTDDPRHLWPWVRQAISVLRPRYAILENVRGHVSLGLDIVLGEMASIGYDAEWQIVSAASVGAPHRRDRVIIVAYPNGRRQQECQSESEQTPGLSCGCEQCTDTIGELANTTGIRCVLRQPQIFTTDRWLNALSLIGSSSADVANPDNTRSGTPRSRIDGNGTQEIQKRDNQPQSGFSGRSTDVANPSQQHSNGEPNNTGHSKRPKTVSQSRDSGRAQRASNWQTEPDVGRVADGVPSRVDRLRGLGNAVVPQVAELIGRMVIDYDTNL
jgi:DNA (cytosine-5)-methyltransferase 1